VSIDNRDGDERLATPPSPPSPSRRLRRLVEALTSGARHVIVLNAAATASRASSALLSSSVIAPGTRRRVEALAASRR